MSERKIKRILKKLLPAAVVMACAGTAMATPQFFVLGSLDGSPGVSNQLNFARAMSGDGQLIGGGAILAGNTVCDAQRGYLWTATGGLEGFAAIGECVTSVWDIDRAGEVVIGSGAPSNPLQPYYWSQGTGFVELPQIFENGGFTFFDPDDSRLDVSGDGSTVVGTGFSIENGSTISDFRPYRWTVDGGYEFMDLPSPGAIAFPVGIDQDGDVIVGFTRSSQSDPTFTPAIWNENGSVTNIEGPEGTALSFFRDVTPDGQVAIGGGRTIVGNFARSYKWTQSEGWTDLGGFPFGGTGGFPLGISADGRVIVGTYTDFGNGSRAYVWTEDTGIVDLQVLAQNAGIDFDGRLLLTAEKVSDDGTVITGVGKNQDGVEDSWVLVLPELADKSGPECAGDADGSGAVDLADLNIVLAQFGSTTRDGDVNNDGVVDLGDLNAVLGAFGSTCS